MRLGDSGFQRLFATTALAGGMLAVPAARAMADIYVTDDSTIHGRVLYNAYVGWDGAKYYDSPTVGVASDAVIWGGLHTYDASTTYYAGAETKGDAELWGNSYVHMLSGSFGTGVILNEQSRFNMSDGYVGYYVKALDHSTASLFGGQVVMAAALNNAHLFVGDCGIFNSIVSINHSTLTVDGVHGAWSYGGYFAPYIESEDQSTAFFRHGYADSATAAGSSTLYMSGGETRVLGVQGNATFDWSGGTFDEVFRDTGRLNIYGSGISAQLIDPNYNYWGFQCAEYTLHGILADGTDINGKTLLVGDGGSFHAFEGNPPVPEPFTLVIGVGALALAAIRRRTR